MTAITKTEFGASAQDAVEPRVVLHLIHGTWSDGKAWVTEGSPFRESLKKQFGRTLEINSIRWTGRNRDRDRREAKAKVMEAVKEKSGSNVYQFLIGHSHGGNVAIYAAADPEISPLLRGVVCLSTPFIAILPREFVWRAITFILWLSWGPMVLLGDRLLHAVTKAPNDLLRIAVSVAIATFGLSAASTITKVWVAKARKAAKRFENPHEDSMKVFALTSGEDEALSVLTLLESLSSVFRILQHPILIVSVALASLVLMAAKVLPSRLIPTWSDWPVAEMWIYAGAYQISLSLLEAVTLAASWRIGLGLGWRDFPFYSLFLVRAVLSPVPLNFSHVNFHSLELEGTSFLAHCRIYADKEAHERVASWISNQLAAQTNEEERN